MPRTIPQMAPQGAVARRSSTNRPRNNPTATDATICKPRELTMPTAFQSWRLSSSFIASPLTAPSVSLRYSYKKTPGLFCTGQNKPGGAYLPHPTVKGILPYDPSLQKYFEVWPHCLPVHTLVFAFDYALYRNYTFLYNALTIFRSIHPKSFFLIVKVQTLTIFLSKQNAI